MSEQIMSDKKRAHSNSPLSGEIFPKTYSKFQEMVSVRYGFVSLKLDKLSLTADVTEDFASAIMQGKFLLFNNFGIAEPNFTKEGELISYKGQYFENEKENWYFEYTPLSSIKMNKRALKIEFTPSKVSREHFISVFNRVLPFMRNIACSTFHLAYDFERDLSELKVNWPNVMYRPIYKGMKLQTMDYGAPRSDYHLTAYDKLQERVDSGDMTEIEIYRRYDFLWRVEYKFYNAGNISKELKNGLPFLSKIPIYIETLKGVEFQKLGVNERIALFALKNKPELFRDADRKTISKYKKLSESISEVNLNVFFQNALDYTEIFNQQPAMVNFFDFMNAILSEKMPDFGD